MTKPCTGVSVRSVWPTPILLRPWSTVHNLGDILHFSTLLTVYERGRVPVITSSLNFGAIFRIYSFASTRRVPREYIKKPVLVSSGTCPCERSHCAIDRKEEEVIAKSRDVTPVTTSHEITCSSRLQPTDFRSQTEILGQFDVDSGLYRTQKHTKQENSCALLLVLSIRTGQCPESRPLHPRPSPPTS